jgi:polysaccharide biosynthesis/export protein
MECDMKSMPSWQASQKHRPRFSKVGVGGIAALVLMLIGFQLFRGDYASAESRTFAPSAYRITAGDKLSVTVFGQTELSGEFVVDQGGSFRLPMVGDIAAVDMTPDELEPQIADALRRGFVKNPVVSVRISEFSSINVVGLVQRPGMYPFRQGLTVLGAIAQAGGIGVAEGRQGSLIGEVLQSEERVRLLEISRAGLLPRRVRLTAQQQDNDQIDFPDMTALVSDSSSVAQIVDGERREFQTARESRQQLIEALERQIPRWKSQIVSIEQQKATEEKQRKLNQELIADFESLLKTGLTRKSAYIEVKREEMRIDGKIAALEADKVKAELSIGDVEFKIAELRSDFRRRLNTDLQDTDRSLMELNITLPSAQRAQAYRAQQVGLVSTQDAQRPTIIVIRQKNGVAERHEAELDAPLRPGDIVQVGSLFGPTGKPPFAVQRDAAPGGSQTPSSLPQPANNITLLHKTNAVATTGSND